MKKYTMITMLIILSLSCLSCYPPDDNPVKRKLKPYNAKKAGAVIVDKFNITKDITFPDRVFKGAADIDSVMIKTPYDIFVNDNDVYIHIEGNIYIFDKNTFTKKREFKVKFPTSEYTDEQYQKLKNDGIPFYDQKNIMFNSLGIVVLENYLLLLGNNRFNSMKNYLFLVELISGNVILVDYEKDLNLEQGYSRYYHLLGYNSLDDVLWFRIAGSNNFFQFAYFDKDSHAFSPYSIKDIPERIGKQDDIDNWWVNINGDMAWYTGYTSRQPDRSIKSIGIDKRHINDPATSLHFIDVEHLGTLSIPQSIAYYDPYIWIMVERDNQIQMLKLLEYP